MAAAGCREDSTAAVKGELPDVMLVRKKYPRRGPSKRIWKLRSLETNTSDEPRNGRRKGEQDANEADFEQFMDHLASDKELRKGINLYRGKPHTHHHHHHTRAHTHTMLHRMSHTHSLTHTHTHAHTQHAPHAAIATFSLSLSL